MNSLAALLEDDAPEREWARRSLLGYTMATKPGYCPAPFHYEIIEALEDVEAGREKRLMIFMPPRHGKSELGSIRFPAWYLGRDPRREIISCSYALTLARSFAYKARDCFSSDIHNRIFGTALDMSYHAMSHWQTTAGGGLIAAGIGGPIGGHGANLLVVDDPVKNQADAFSETYQERIFDWYNSTAYPRLEPGGAVIVITTRWNENDLAGRLLAGTRDKWRVLSWPALDAEGNPLWPERFSRLDYERIREVIGPRAWNALYMQNPKPEDSERVLRSEQLRRWSRPMERDDFERVIASWDTAFSNKTTADYSVGEVWGQRADGFYLIELERGRWTFRDIQTRMIAMNAKWNLDAVLIEKAASGHDLLSVLRRESDLPIIGITPRGDKLSRAAAVSGRIEAGRVFVPESAPWLAAFISELDHFPNGRHDDQVDALSQAISWLGRTALRLVEVVDNGAY